uniref:Uncharacterized protein n=1 Tax=Arundo donax TaxID=35708 RepID=A0A0A8YS42_ARUDO
MELHWYFVGGGVTVFRFTGYRYTFL